MEATSGPATYAPICADITGGEINPSDATYKEPNHFPHNIFYSIDTTYNLNYKNRQLQIYSPVPQYFIHTSDQQQVAYPTSCNICKQS